jgi:MFS family permease
MTFTLPAPIQVSRPVAFGLVAYAFTVTMLGTTLPTPLYPLYQSQYHFGGLMVTVIFAVYAVGVMAGLLLFGGLSDQLGRRPVLLPGLALSAASAVVFAVASPSGGGVPLLLVGRVLSGLSAGIFTGTATATLIDLAPRQRRGRANVIAAVVNMGGLGLGPLLSGILAAYAPDPLRLCYLLDLGLLGVAAVGVLLSPEPVQRQGPVRLRARHLGVPAEVRSTFVPAATAGFAAFAVAGMFGAVTPAFLGQLLHVTNTAVVGVVVFGLTAGIVTTSVASTRIADRRAMLTGCAGLFVAMGLLAASLATRSLPLLVVAIVGSGLGHGAAFRAGLSMINDATPAGQRAEVNSSYFVTLYVALVIPVVGIGAAADGFGLVTAGIAFAITVATLTLAAALGIRNAPEVAEPPRQAG